MAEGEANHGRGDVTFAAGGRAYTLRPTLGAAKGISKSFGGFLGAFSRVRAYDFEAMALIVGFGLDMNAPEQTEEVEQITYDAGVQKLVEPLCMFIERLANRGLPPAVKAKADPKKKG